VQVFIGYDLLKFGQHDGKNLKERVDGLTSKLEDLERSSSTCATLLHEFAVF
jgi:hypothetical protein